ncbi:MAG: TolC family protein [Sphingobacteriia bacterium]|nr:TolC family protein [Sphingobacteriia bacterium]
MKLPIRNIILILFLFTFSYVRSQESISSLVNEQYLQKLVDTAKKYYPKNKTFDHKINFANEALKKAHLSWYDVITFSLAYSPTNTTNATAVTLTGFQAGIFVNLGSLLVKPNNIRQAKEDLAIAELNKKEYALNLEAEVKSRYYKYLQQTVLLKLQNQRAFDWEVYVKQVKYKFEKGEETLESYSKALVSLSEQKQYQTEAEGALLIAKSYLEEIIGKKLEEVH